MKDDAVERVLAGLGKVEAAAGLEGRVLRRLAEQSKERSSAWGWDFGLAAGTVLVGACIWQFGGSARRGGEHSPGAKAQSVGHSERPKAEALGYLATKASSRDSFGHQQEERIPLAKRPFIDRTESPKAEALDSVQATAKAEGLESFPAPPEPLTAQERLLVWVARHPRAGEVEFLIAEVREAELIKSNAEFDLFFPPPQSLESTEVSQPVEAKEKNNEIQPKIR